MLGHSYLTRDIGKTLGLAQTMQCLKVYQLLTIIRKGQFGVTNWYPWPANQSPALGEVQAPILICIMFSFLSDVMVLAGLYLAHSSQHKMKSVLLPVSVKKINIIRTELAICYPIKTWPWSSGTGFPTAQAATDSTPEEITMAEGLSCEIYFLAWGHQMFGSRYANVTICVRINIPSKQQAHMHAHTLSLPQLLYSK